jgi:lipid-A-disaccharide synthase-like uncharacterized protein
MIESFLDWLLAALRNPWTTVGILGQLIFSARFLTQWIASERAGRSVVPGIFWYLSIAGSLVLLTYALHLRDLVFTLGQSMGFFIYARNLVLRKREEGT